MLVAQGTHGQVDGSSGHPTRLIGSHERCHVRYLRERHNPSRVGHASEIPLELLSIQLDQRHTHNLRIRNPDGVERNIDAARLIDHGL